MSKVYDERLLFSQTILDRLDMEAEADGDAGDTTNAFWWAVTQAPDRRIIAQSNYNMAAERHDIVGEVIHPTADQVGYAVEASKILNKDVHHDGFWIVGWTHPPAFANLISVNPDYHWRRLIKVWVDDQGDPQFTCDCIDPFWLIASAGPEDLIQQSEEAWQNFKYHMRDDMDYTEDQLKPTAILRERNAA